MENLHQNNVVYTRVVSCRTGDMFKNDFQNFMTPVTWNYAKSNKIISEGITFKVWIYVCILCFSYNPVDVRQLADSKVRGECWQNIWII